MNIDHDTITREIHRELQAAREMLDRLLASPTTLAAIEAAAVLLAQALAGGAKVVVCGNGGSMCDAMHFAAELTAKFRLPRRPLPALAACDPAFLSAVANDFGFETVFARYVEALGVPGDVLVAISTSGNSANVIHAIAAGRNRGMKIIALTGKDGGAIAGHADVEVRAPDSPFPERVQELHIKILHLLTSLIEQCLRLPIES